MSLFTDPLSFGRIYFRDSEYSPRQVNGWINSLASFIQSNASSYSPFVYLFARNHIKSVVAYFAIIRAGKICVLIDPDIKKLELDEIMLDTPPCAWIRFSQNSAHEFDYAAEILPMNGKTIDMQDLVNVCTMKYTAADDGYAKAVMLTANNIISNTTALIHAGKVSGDNISAALLPLYSLYGLQTGVLTPILAGGSVCIEDISNLSGIKTIMNHIEKYEVNYLSAVPAMYYLIQKIPEAKHILHKTGILVTGGYMLQQEIFDSFRRKTGKQLLNGYGLTEASPVCTWHRPGDVIRPGSVGQSLSCCEIAIMDSFNLPLPLHKVGEICIRGDNVMKGYYNNPAATSRTIINGWLHTGDLGTMDQDGYVYCTSILKNMLNRGGKNVYPKEVQRLMKSHYNVEEVLNGGEVSEVRGNTFQTVVKLKSNTLNHQAEFKAWCDENISRYKLPSSIIFI